MARSHSPEDEAHSALAEPLPPPLDLTLRGPAGAVGYDLQVVRGPPAARGGPVGRGPLVLGAGRPHDGQR
jgi:hypothetical protein